MTDLSELEGLFDPVDETWPPTPVLEREPRKCRRHQWPLLQAMCGVINCPIVRADETAVDHEHCLRCGAVKSPERIRRGKASRNRGNAFEREVAAKLGGRRVGQFGDKVDVSVDGYLRVQCKNGATYPERMDGWLRAIPVEAGLLRAVVLGDAPGSAGKRRSLIVFDLDEYAMWHGGKR